MQPVFLFKNVPEQWAVMSLAPQDSALLCQPFYSWSMSEVIDKDTRSSERTDYPHYASEVALALVHEWLASNWQK